MLTLTPCKFCTTPCTTPCTDPCNRFRASPLESTRQPPGNLKNIENLRNSGFATLRLPDHRSLSAHDVSEGSHRSPRHTIAISFPTDRKKERKNEAKPRGQRGRELGRNLRFARCGGTVRIVHHGTGRTIMSNGTAATALRSRKRTSGPRCSNSGYPTSGGCSTRCAPTATHGASRRSGSPCRRRRPQ
jgi:hypothetical protein